MILSVIFLLLLAAVEGSFISFPLVLIYLLFLTLLRKDNFVLNLAFLGGLILDIFYMRRLGATSIFFLCFLYSMLLYRNKFEISNFFFITIFTFLGTFVYFLLFSPVFILQKTLISVFLVTIFSKILLKRAKQENLRW